MIYKLQASFVIVFTEKYLFSTIALYTPLAFYSKVWVKNANKLKIL